MFNLKKNDDEEGEAPTRSILGLGGLGPSPFRAVAAAVRHDQEPPGESLLGLGGEPLRPFGSIPRPTGEPPTESLLGLRGIPTGPIAREALTRVGDAEPPNASLLGLERIAPSPLPPVFRTPRRGARTAVSGFGPTGPPKATSIGPAPSRSFFGLQAPFDASGRPARDLAEIEVPEFERDVSHHAEPAFPVERAILMSLAAHALIVLLLLWVPAGKQDASKGLLAALVPPAQTDQEKIPIIFREAPGPARQNPKKSDLSDADRRAGGGDRSKPKAESPFVAQRQGKQGLAPGPRRPPSAPALPPPGSEIRQAQAGKGPNASAPGEGKPAAPEPSAASEQALLEPRSAPGTSGTTPGGKTAPTLQGLHQAIRDAARGVGASGEDGAGFPNPGGGFVDSGPLSFDTTWYDWGPYAAEMIRRIKLHWDVPELARFGFKGRVTVRFYIRADGSVEDARILSVSGTPPYDYAALQAIVTSSPFRPLPRDLGEDREGVTVTFFYNLRPGEAGTGASN